MNRQTIPLGKILGIPIGLDYSWFLIFALLTWTLAVSYFPAQFQGWPALQYWVVGAVTAIMLFVSVLLHELGHSALALRYRIPVKRITLLIFGGVAEIGQEPPSAAAEFWIAIAGPIVSFTLAGVFRLLQPLLGGAQALLALATYLAYINGTLGLFNLIPGFPLDGGRVFRAIMWGATRDLRRATIIAANVGRGIAFLFIMLGVWQMFSGNFGNGLWIAFIGWFLENAASAQVRQQAIQDLLAGHRVSQVMSRNYTFIPAAVTIQELLDHYILGRGRRCFLVRQGETVVGLLTLHHIREIPPEQRAATTARQVMMPVDRMKQVSPQDELWTALQQMDRDGVNQLPVMEAGQLQGMLSREDVISFLRTLQAIGA